MRIGMVVAFASGLAGCSLYFDEGGQKQPPDARIADAQIDAAAVSAAAQ
jgi:hypothetical protein